MSDKQLFNLNGEPSDAASLPHLPSSWCWASLEDIIQNFDGCRIPVKSDDRDKRSGPYPYYGASGVIDDIDDFIFDGDYLLIAEDGANLLSRSTPIAFQANGKFWVNNHAHIVQTRGGMPLAYLQWYLNGTNLQFFITGTAQPKLNQINLNRIPAPVAPIAEQRRIVAKIEELFSDLDVGVAALKRAKANLKRYRAAVLKAAVEGKLTEEWRVKHPAKEPASVLLARVLKERRQKWEADQLAKFASAGKKPPKNWREKYVEPSQPDTKGLPRLPDGWCWCTASQICEVVASGSTPSADRMQEGNGDVPFLKVYNLTFTGILDFSIRPTFIDLETHLRQSRSIVLPGDVLINIVGPPLGKVSIVPDDFSEWNINQAIVVFRPTNSILNRYLATALMTDSVMKRVTSLAKATAGQFNIGVSMCRDLLPLPLAPLVEQQQIVSQVAELLSQIESAETIVQQGLLRAFRLRQSILNHAFEGKLVPQDPNDEPASVLLERLRESQADYDTKSKAKSNGRPAKQKKLERMVGK